MHLSELIDRFAVITDEDRDLHYLVKIVYEGATLSRPDKIRIKLHGISLF